MPVIERSLASCAGGIIGVIAGDAVQSVTDVPSLHLMITLPVIFGMVGVVFPMLLFLWKDRKEFDKRLNLIEAHDAVRMETLRGVNDKLSMILSKMMHVADEHRQERSDDVEAAKE